RGRVDDLVVAPVALVAIGLEEAAAPRLDLVGQLPPVSDPRGPLLLEPFPSAQNALPWRVVHHWPPPPRMVENIDCRVRPVCVRRRSASIAARTTSSVRSGGGGGGLGTWILGAAPIRLSSRRRGRSRGPLGRSAPGPAPEGN